MLATEFVSSEQPVTLRVMLDRIFVPTKTVNRLDRLSNLARSLQAGSGDLINPRFHKLRETQIKYRRYSTE